VGNFPHCGNPKTILTGTVNYTQKHCLAFIVDNHCNIVDTSNIDR